MNVLYVGADGVVYFITPLDGGRVKAKGEENALALIRAARRWIGKGGQGRVRGGDPVCVCE